MCTFKRFVHVDVYIRIEDFIENVILVTARPVKPQLEIDGVCFLPNSFTTV